ncbi:VanZ family protein [Halobacillus shinanisalinarum]|uniref:VanZ family protein n=1 Tax=Halobacillus shinanisalinarum TaxID=2932258 RepID=A0ABY4H2C9_9BACI|nr:VanZ family protein [Halobacillus shinanisalinarum]UOQ94441.1 VanZ family protein [Halobacillus shinanisalinarum]
MKKLVYWIPSIVWMGVIFYSSSTPYQEQDVKPFLSDWFELSGLAPLFAGISFTYHHSEVSVATLGIAGFIEFFIRKGAHVTVYLLLTLLIFYALHRTTNRNYQSIMLISWIATVLYAITDELHQGITPNRTPYVGDVMLDALGGLIATLLISVVYFIRRRNDARL